MKLKYPIYYIFCSLLSILMLTSCIEEFEGNLPQEQSQLIVVDGTIYSDSLSYFYLTRSMQLNADELSVAEEGRADPVSNAKLSVVGSDGSSYPVERYRDYFKDQLNGTEAYGLIDGTYVGKMPKLNPDVDYHLKIEVQGDVYESAPEKPISTAGIDSVEWYQQTKKSDVDILITTQKLSDSSSPVYYEWKMDDTWEVRPRLDSYWEYDTEQRKVVANNDLYPHVGWKFGSNKESMVASTAHYSNQQMQKHKLFTISRSDERIYYNYSGLMKQRAISKGEYEYRLACSQASDEMGGLFSPQATTLPTNIHCVSGSKHALGYVGVSMNEYHSRFYIDCGKISRIFPAYPKIEEITNPTHDEYVNWMQRDYRIAAYKEDPVTNTITVSWAKREFFDIRLHGATTDKPSYMP